jgi:hypothetical protein
MISSFIAALLCGVARRRSRPARDVVGRAPRYAPVRARQTRAAASSGAGLGRRGRGPQDDESMSRSAVEQKSTVHGVRHFSLTVEYLDRSVAFHCGLLGLELVHRQVQDNA